MRFSKLQNAKTYDEALKMIGFKSYKYPFFAYRPLQDSVRRRRLLLALARSKNEQKLHYIARWSIFTIGEGARYFTDSICSTEYVAVAS